MMFPTPGVWGPTGLPGTMGVPGRMNGWTGVINTILNPLGFGLLIYDDLLPQGRTYNLFLTKWKKLMPWDLYYNTITISAEQDVK